MIFKNNTSHYCYYEVEYYIYYNKTQLWWISIVFLTLETFLILNIKEREGQWHMDICSCLFWHRTYFWQILFRLLQRTKTHTKAYWARDGAASGHTLKKKLIDLFHAANHVVSYDTVRRLDTSIAKNILDRYRNNGYTYIPEGIIRGPFLHCSCDNIDVLEETLDGKNTLRVLKIIFAKNMSCGKICDM